MFQAVAFGILLAMPLTAFTVMALNAGWPQKTFFFHVSRPKRILVISISFASVLVPILVSCVLYILVYYSVVITKRNQIGVIKARPENSQNVQGQNQVCLT